MSYNIYNRNSKRTKGMTKPKNPTHNAAKAAAPAAVFAALPLIAFLLVGCSVGPRYKGTTAKLQPFHTAPSIEARKIGCRAKSATISVRWHLPDRMKRNAKETRGETRIGRDCRSSRIRRSFPPHGALRITLRSCSRHRGFPT